jgi:hypothetical protein
MRHRKMFVDVEAEVDEDDEELEEDDIGFGLFHRGGGSKLRQLIRASDVANIGVDPPAAPTHIESNKRRNVYRKESGTLIQRLIARQSFEGSWRALSERLCKEMNIKSEYASGEPTLLTAIVVVYLARKMRDEEDTWELVVEKARNWLESVVAEDVLADVWKMAEKIVA